MTKEVHSLSLPKDLKSQVESVEVFWDFRERQKYRGRLPLMLDLFELRKWRNLRRVTIQVQTGSCGQSHMTLRMLYHTSTSESASHVSNNSSMSNFSQQLAIFSEASGLINEGSAATYTGGFLSHIERIIVFKTDDATFYPSSSYPFRKFPKSKGPMLLENPNETISKIAVAFGGSLILDDIIRFQDGKYVAPVYQDFWVGDEKYESDTSMWC